MTMEERLLALSESLVEDGAHSLTLKRRAVSTAYYSVFHALAKVCADEIAFDRKSDTYTRVYRALDHGTLKSAFKNPPLSQIASIQKIGSLAVELQSERIKSDYLPSQRLYTKRQALDLVRSARIAMTELKKLPADERKTLSIYLLFKSRP